MSLTTLQNLLLLCGLGFLPIMSVSVLMAIFRVELGKPVPERTRSVFHWSYKDDGGGGDYWSYKTCQTVTTNTTQLL